MKLECENVPECAATPELIRECVRTASRRGEFMVMMREDDEEAFVQIACDYDQTGGRDDGRFDLEYREGKDGSLYHCTRRVSADEAEAVFLDELDGRPAWRIRYPWEKVKGDGASARPFGMVVAWISGFVVALSLLAFAWMKVRAN